MFIIFWPHLAGGRYTGAGHLGTPDQTSRSSTLHMRDWITHAGLLRIDPTREDKSPLDIVRVGHLDRGVSGLRRLEVNSALQGLKERTAQFGAMGKICTIVFILASTRGRRSELANAAIRNLLTPAKKAAFSASIETRTRLGCTSRS